MPSLGLGLGLGRLNGRLQGAGQSYDPDAVAIFSAFTTPPDNARKTAINNCVIALKASGAWAVLDCLWVIAAANSQAASINWKTPGSFSLIPSNSPSFLADRGYSGDGSSSYLATGYTPSTAGGQFTVNSAHISGWSRSPGTASSTERMIGNLASSGSRSVITPRFTADQYSSLLNEATGTSFPSLNRDGYFVTNRSGASARQAYRNGVSLGSDTQASLALPTNAITLLRDGSNFATLQISAASIGASLSASQVAAQYSALQNYMTAVGA